MDDLSLLHWIALAISGMIIGVTKTGIPGVGILAIPLTAMVFQGRTALGFVLPLLMVADLIAVVYYRRNVVWRYLLPLIPWALGGIIIGYFLLGVITDRQLLRFIGIMVLVILALHNWRQYRARDDDKIPTQWWFAAIVGIFAGVTTMMTNAAGPIMVVYLIAMRLPKREFIGTGAWYFMLMNWTKVPFSVGRGLITRESLLLDLWIVPCVVFGALAGIFIMKRIPQRAFAAVIQVLAAVAAITLFLR
jgi:hypothetical protein